MEAKLADGTWNVPKTRSGRRSISASTLLKKDKEGTLYKRRSVGPTLDEARDKTLDQIEEKTAGKYGKNSAGFDLQGKTEVQGLPIAIENKPGSVREGKNEDGSKWKTKFKSPYGYIEGTKGADGEEIDAYVGPDKGSDQAFVVHQKKQDGSHDEDTIMLGYVDKQKAKADILRHYDDKSQVGSIDQLPIGELKEKLDKANGKKISKVGSGLGSEQANLDYRDGDRTDMTGIPAMLRRKKGEGPTRELQDPYPNPKTENRQDLQESKTTGGFTSPEGFDDVGKTAEMGLNDDRALGDQRKSWEGGTRDEVGASSPEKHRLRTATGSEAVVLSDLSPEAKTAQLEGALRSGFLEELSKIAEAGGAPAWRGELSEFASSQLVDDIIKEALFRELAGGLERGLVGGVSPQGIPMKGVLSGFKGVGQRMEQAGSRMMTSPMQRIQAAGAGAGEASQLAQQAQRFGVKAPGVVGRVGGEAVQTAGKHVVHSSPLQLAVNPIGTVLGGGIEGATRGAGRELVRSTGMAGEAGAGGVRAGLGRAMQTHAPKVGLLGEVGALGAMGGLAHLPLSGAGALGGHMAHASTGLSQGLSALGPIGGHIGADALGTAAQRGARFVPAAARAAGRLVQAEA